jgi:hypothetical protein
VAVAVAVAGSGSARVGMAVPARTGRQVCGSCGSCVAVVWQVQTSGSVAVWQCDRYTQVSVVAVWQVQTSGSCGRYQ